MSLFSTWLDGRMKGNGWNQRQLADALRVKETMVSKWLHGSTKPSGAGILRICYVFKVDPLYVYELIHDRVVADMTPPKQRKARHAELLARLPQFAKVLDRLAQYPPEKLDVYVDLILQVLPKTQEAQSGQE